MLRLSTLLVLGLLLPGCASLSATDRQALETAAAELDRQLEPPGRIAATALLLREANGAYPTTPFELLSSETAAATGLRALPLSALALDAEGDALRIRYTLLPTPADPSTRYGSLVLSPADEAGRYDVALSLDREADPDLYDERLPLAREGNYAVRRATGRLCAEVEAVRARLAAADEVGDPPLGGATAYTVTFRPADGVGGEELGDGFTVTVAE